MTAPHRPPPTRARGVAALAAAGFLFGSTFLVVQGAIERADVVPFLAVRFLVGAAVLWPLARRRPATPGAQHRRRSHGHEGAGEREHRHGVEHQAAQPGGGE